MEYIKTGILEDGLVEQRFRYQNHTRAFILPQLFREKASSASVVAL